MHGFSTALPSDIRRKVYGDARYDAISVTTVYSFLENWVIPVLPCYDVI